MRNIFTTFLFFVAPFIFSSSIYAQGDSDVSTSAKVVEYLVTADSANLREEASTNSSIVGTATKGESLLIYEETPEVSGWLRIYREEETDAYIADFLVERAPMRFYPPQQEPLIVASGRGGNITDIYDIPKGAYRIDATVDDNAFILHVIAVEGNCRDSSIFNEANFDVRKLTLSGLFVSSGCSVLFETDNVDGNWQFEIRDLLDPEFLADSVLEVEDGTSISGAGRSLTMPTKLGAGIWSISGIVKDQAFILHSNVLTGECDDESVFNELDFGTDQLEISTVYRNSGKDDCVIFWETENVEGEWAITFEKLR